MEKEEAFMFQSEIAFAEKLADASGDVVLTYFRTPVRVDDKADASPVTIADRESERVMREMIRAAYPHHGIIGEEYGRENENAEFAWVLDPIDGTKSFITGKPVFGTLIALLHNGLPVLGIINQPYTRERWVGAKGRRTTLNGREIATRQGVPLEKSVLYTTGGRGMFSEEEQERFNVLESRVKLTRYSADSYAYGLLALGCVDIVCEAGMKLYDYAALVPVVEGAGGFMSDWEGRPLGASSDGRVLALGDRELFGAVAGALDT